MSKIEAIKFENDVLMLIDQRKLPTEYVYFECKNTEEIVYAIADMVVRGAPAIGAAAAYGVVLSAIEFKAVEQANFIAQLNKACERIRKARPTAVNLSWAVDRMKGVIENHGTNNRETLIDLLRLEAQSIQKEDVETNRKMAEFGNSLIKHGDTILTHCNTGALATAGIGTALGVVRAAHESGKKIKVYADETRPRLQGGRLTAWELVEEGIPARLIADNVAATLIRDGEIDVILVGADRIATNGDTANKIGTYMLSVVAKVFNIPFYIVAPTTTIDFDINSGFDIEIEERDAREVTHIRGIQIAPEGIDVYNPAFDVTPSENITGIVTEQGVLYPPYDQSIGRLKD